MDVKLELIVLLIQSIASNSFAHFEIGTPALRKIFKWLFMDATTIGLYYWIGHWSLLLPAIILIAGITYHFIWCKKNGIDPLKATPKRKYYQLRGWKLEEDNRYFVPHLYLDTPNYFIIRHE
jgi:hypothetical protein